MKYRIFSGDGTLYEPKPNRPGKFYDHESLYSYLGNWRFIKFFAEDLWEDQYGNIVKEGGSIGWEHGRFAMYVNEDVYDAVRLEDMAMIELEDDGNEDEYQGIGVYREVDLGIDESLLGVRSYSMDWEIHGGESGASKLLSSPSTSVFMVSIIFIWFL